MKHAVVWIDHKEAHVLEVDAEKVDEVKVRAPGAHIHRHPKDLEQRIRNHPDDEHRFFREVAKALVHDGQILLVGPSMTKLRFFKFLQQHDLGLEKRIVGIESADHPSDAQLVAHLRQYFNEAAPRGRVEERDKQ